MAFIRDPVEKKTYRVSSCACCMWYDGHGGESRPKITNTIMAKEKETGTPYFDNKIKREVHMGTKRKILTKNTFDNIGFGKGPIEGGTIYRTNYGEKNSPVWDARRDAIIKQLASGPKFYTC